MLNPLRTLVVGVASLDGVDPVLAHAGHLARELGATLHAVHASDGTGPAEAAGVPPDRVGAVLHARLEAMVRAHAPGVRAACHVVEGAATERLPEMARETGADLLVVGATRKNRVWRQFLGTTAEGVVRRAGIPVLVQRSALDGGLRRALVATDLSEASAEVHERGLDLVDAICRECHPEIRSLLVVPDVHPATPEARASLERRAQRELDAFVRRQRPRARGVQCKVRIGDVADEILAEASEWNASLVVLGTRGSTAPAGPHLGSTLGATLRAAACNVLVIPPAPGPSAAAAAEVRAAQAVAS